jgi:uncharacterized membrane protein
MITVAITMLSWMLLTIFSIAYPSIVGFIRSWMLTPIIVILTVLIWSYAIIRTKRKIPLINEILEREEIQ